MQEQREKACSLALQVATLLADCPRGIAIDAIDIARILFRPPVNRAQESPDPASPVNLEGVLQVI